jgi:hypothetical protein
VCLQRGTSSIFKLVRLVCSFSPSRLTDALGLSGRKPGFDPGSVRARHVVDRGALGRVFSEWLVFTLKCHTTNAPHPYASTC